MLWMNKTEQELSRITTIDFSPLKFMSFMPTDPQEVRSIILGLRSKSASGLDKITAKILKQNFFSLVPPITYMGNISQHRSCSDILKRVVVFPIFKSGKRNEPNNYRPISLLSTLSKILEKTMIKISNHEIFRTKQAPQWFPIWFQSKNINGGRCSDITLKYSDVSK